MIGNAISTHILEVMQGICQAAKSMNANVLFFLGIHCGFYYKLNELEDIDKDFDYQFNTIYDYQDFADSFWRSAIRVHAQLRSLQTIITACTPSQSI